MPVDCRIDGTTVSMPSKRDCTGAGGTVIAPPDKKPDNDDDCFVRNVFARALSSTVLDIGWSDAVGQGLIDALSVPSRRKNAAGSKRRRGIVKLTPVKRGALAARAGKTILTLASTYPTTREFRDGLLATTRRGRQWKRYYDRHLREIFHVAHKDLELMNASATTWLALYPFTRAMVRAASGGRRRAAKKIVFTKRDHRTCVSLIRRFRKGSENARFRKVLTELQGELAGYAGLTPEEAVARLQKSPPR
jgi:hypothetical protein